MVAFVVAVAAIQAVAGGGEAALPAASRAVPPGTSVQLMVINEVSTRTGKPGDRFVVRVNAPVTRDAATVIPVGTTGVGEIVAASESGIGGRSGKLATRLLYLEVGGRRVRIGGNFASAGTGAGGQMVAFTALISPIGILTRGNNAKIKAGEIVDGVLVDGFDPDRDDSRTP